MCMKLLMISLFDIKWKLLSLHISHSRSFTCPTMTINCILNLASVSDIIISGTSLFLDIFTTLTIFLANFVVYIFFTIRKFIWEESMYYSKPPNFAWQSDLMQHFATILILLTRLSLITFILMTFSLALAFVLLPETMFNFPTNL